MDEETTIHYNYMLSMRVKSDFGGYKMGISSLEGLAERSRDRKALDTEDVRVTAQGRDKEERSAKEQFDKSCERFIIDPFSDPRR